MRLLLRTLVCLALLPPGLVPAGAAEWEWTEFQQSLPGEPPGPALASQPIQLDNPLLRKINEKLYEVPWAPGEAILLQPQPGAGALSGFGFWRGPDEYQLLVSQGGQWRCITPAGTTDVTEPRLAYFGHEVSGQPVEWTGPARIVAVGAGGAEALEITRVPLFEAG